MARLDFQRAAWLEGPRRVGGDVPLREMTPLQAARQKLPGADLCRRCEEGFLTTGEETRPRPIHLCPGCRDDLEQEGSLNGLRLDLSDDDLRKALATIATFESRICRAMNPARAFRLRKRLAQLTANARSLTREQPENGTGQTEAAA